MRIKPYLAALSLWLLTSISHAQPPTPLQLLEGGSSLLEPEVAFAVDARIESNALVVNYRIAAGYYLYVDKLGFSSASPGVTLGKAMIPLGELHNDEFFGDVEILRGAAKIEIPFTSVAAGTKEFILAVNSQGCADVGVCYQPLAQRLNIAVPATLSIASTASAAPSGKQGDSAILEPDQAFVLRLDDSLAPLLQLHWQIAPGHYLYQERMHFALDNPEVRLGEASYSASTPKEDAYFGKMHVFHERAQASLLVLNQTQTSTARLHITYQGCSELSGICYPPITKTLKVKLRQAGISPAPSATPEPIAEQDQFTALLSSRSYWLVLTAFFGAGLLLALTPCVFPMFPILSSVIVGHGHQTSRRHAFGLSLIYVLSMTITFTAVGVVIGLTGENIQIWLQNPWVLSAMAGLFVLLALSMFGFYDLQMPLALQNRLNALSGKQKSGSSIGVAIMGVLSALIVGPCITPPLVGALVYIAQTGDALQGGSALFMLGLGMGLPLLILGGSAGHLLPKAGLWMDNVKAIFGVALLAMAIWMLERILPKTITMGLWAGLLIVSAVYLGALEPIKASHSGWSKLWKGIGFIALVAGILLLIGAATGNTSMIYPLRTLAGGGVTSHVENESPLPFRRIKSLTDLEQQLTTASSRQQPVMLDFYADWCISCKEMEAFTFTDPAVRAALKNTLLLQADVTANDSEDQALLQKFGLYGPPAILFFDQQAKEQSAYRVVGFMKADAFHARLQQVNKP